MSVPVPSNLIPGRTAESENLFVAIVMSASQARIAETLELFYTADRTSDVRSLTSQDVLVDLPPLLTFSLLVLCANSDRVRWRVMHTSLSSRNWTTLSAETSSVLTIPYTLTRRDLTPRIP